MKAITILFILTSHSVIGESGDKTGLWLEEFTTPYYEFQDAGYEIDIASIQGGVPPIDPRSLGEEKKTQSVVRFESDPSLKNSFNNSIAIKNVDIAKYDAVFLPGGHGTMWDLPNNKELSEAISKIYQSGRVVAAVCHGPAGLVGPIDVNGDPIIKGKKVIGFTNTEEAAVELTEAVPFLLETKLLQLGADYQKGPDFEPFALSDGNLVTGQNPASSKKVAELVIKILETNKEKGNKMTNLFSEFTLKDVKLRNRIAVPPMCQYSAQDGVPNDWHLAHYTQIARGGAGLVIVEATAVAAEGRISPNCLGLWNEEQAAEHKKIAAAIKNAGAVPGIQIAHAGIKASANRPWEGDDHIPNDDPRAWDIIGPSAKSFGSEGLNKMPKEMTHEDIRRVQNDFVQAAQKALDAGYEWLELHFAHGYLAQSFFSRHNNQRDDEYGGSVENRGRYLLETMKAVRDVWPQSLPFTARFGVIEFDGHDEETLKDSINLVKKFKQIRLDFISVSLGFSTPDANIPWGAAFMAPYARRVREETGLPVGSAWGFGQPHLAQSAVANGDMDIVFVGRSVLANPHWPYEAAQALHKSEPSWVLPAPYAHWLEKYRI